MNQYDANIQAGMQVQNPGNTYQNAMNSMFSNAADFAGSGIGAKAAAASNQANVRQQMADENATELERINRIQQLQMDIKKIEDQLAAIPAERAAIEQEFKDSVYNRDNKLTTLENQMSANRARRYTKDNESVDLWKWKREQAQKKDIADMQYRWQKDENKSTDEMLLGDYDHKVAQAFQQLRITKESASAGRASQGDVDAAKELYKYALEQRNKFAETIGKKWNYDYGFRSLQDPEDDGKGTTYKTLLAEVNVFNNSGWNHSDKENIIKAIDDSELDGQQKAELKSKLHQSTEEMNAGALAQGGVNLTVQDQADQAAANKLTLDQLIEKFGKGSLNKWEEAALKKKKPELQKIHDNYKNETSTNKKKALYNKYKDIWQKVEIKVE